MSRRKIVLLLTAFLMAFSGWQCQKDEADWVFCDGCGLEAWAGVFSGTGSYVNGETDQITDGVEVTVDIQNPEGNQLYIKVLSPGYFSQSFYSSKTDSAYYFDLAGAGSSIHLNLYQKEGAYKLTGVSKQYHASGDSVVIDHILSFEVEKE